MKQNLTEHGLAFPQVHLNGTSKEALEEGLRDAAAAVEKAREMLQGAAPHGRDYYVQTSAAFTLAQAQHLKRLESLNTIYTELTEVWEAVANQ